jgi:hypothetical protein
MTKLVGRRARRRMGLLARRRGSPPCGRYTVFVLRHLISGRFLVPMSSSDNQGCEPVNVASTRRNPPSNDSLINNAPPASSSSIDRILPSFIPPQVNHATSSCDMTPPIIATSAVDLLLAQAKDGCVCAPDQFLLPPYHHSWSVLVMQ